MTKTKSPISRASPDGGLIQTRQDAARHYMGNQEHSSNWKPLTRTRRHLFVFVTNRDIPATNNGSERALRPCAVFRKITNGFRTEWGARLYADIRSVIETARRRAIGVKSLPTATPFRAQ